MPALAGESPPKRNPLTPPVPKSTTCNVENDNNTQSPGPTMSRAVAEYTLIDLFSGAGGFTHGFKEAGFKPILAVEKEQDFADTYEENFGAHVNLPT
jgi:C-5 cytosine-specific DNA methylase